MVKREQGYLLDIAPSIVRLENPVAEQCPTSLALLFWEFLCVVNWLLRLKIRGFKKQSKLRLTSPAPKSFAPVLDTTPSGPKAF